MNMMKNSKVQVTIGDNSQFEFTYEGKTWKTNIEFEPYLEIRKKDKYEKYLFSEAEKIDTTYYTTGFSQGYQTVYSCFPFDKEFSFATSVEIDEYSNKVVASILPLNDSLTNLHRIFWPSPIVFEKNEASSYSVMPIMQGCLVTNGSDEEIDLTKRWEFEAEYTYTRANTMPWWGQIEDREGYMTIINTPFDAGVDFYHKKGGCSRSAVKWHSQLGKIGYRRECTYYTFSDCDYNTCCKTYREYLIEKGELCTLEEKIIKNPNVKKLIGSSVFHSGICRNLKEGSFAYKTTPPESRYTVVTFDEMGNKIKKIKAEGLEKVFVHIDGWIKEGYDNQHPDTMPPCENAGGIEGMLRLKKTIQDAGYQFAVHDQYRDYYVDAPSYNKTYSKKNYDGKAPSFSLWDGGEQEFLCPQFYLGFVKRNMNRMWEAGLKLDGIYLDVFSCVALDECYDKEHRVTREQCKAERKSCFDYMRSLGCIVSSEEGIGWAMKDLDLVHRMVYAKQYIPDESQMCGKILPESVGIPVPLHNLVYHDCVVVPWFTDHVHEEVPNHEKGFLHALLNGGISYITEDATPDEVEQVKILSSLHSKIGIKEMLCHEFLNSDRTKQKTVFSNGISVEVDFKNNTYQIVEKGNSTD